MKNFYLLLLITFICIKVIQTKLPKIGGSFIEDWMYIHYNESRWEQEVKYYYDLGLKYFILGSVANEDWIPITPLEPGQYEFDWTKYVLKDDLWSNRIVYNSSEFPHLYYPGNDGLLFCFKYCKKYGLKAFIGPVTDGRFARYGWGVENMKNYFPSWIDDFVKKSEKIYKEIWEKYKDYRDQIAGFYFWPEYWNFYEGCNPNANQEHHEVWKTLFGKLLHNFDEMVSNITSNSKPILMSPFHNFDICTAENNSNWLIEFFNYTKLRKGTIYAPQDSMGGHYKNHIHDIGEWCKGEKKACDSAGIRYWINNEIFRDKDDERYPDRDPDVPCAPFEEVINQVKETDIAETHLFFTLTWYGTRNVIDHWTDHAKNKSFEFYYKFKEYCDKYNHDTEDEKENEKKEGNEGNGNDKKDETLLNEDKSYWWLWVLIILLLLIIIGVVIYIYFRRKKAQKDDQLIGSLNV